MRNDETSGVRLPDRDEEALRVLDAELTAAFRRAPLDLREIVAAMDEPVDAIEPADLDSIFVEPTEAPREPPPRRPDRPVAPAILPRRRSVFDRHRTLLAATVVVMLATGGAVLKIGVDPIVAAGKGLVRLVMEGPAERPRIVIEELSPDKLPDPLAPLHEETREALVDKFAMPTVQPFKVALITPPDTVCKALAGAGLPNYGWLPVAEGSAVYECLSDLVPIPNPAISAEAIPEPTPPSDLRPEEDGDAPASAPVVVEPVDAEFDPEEALKPQLSTFFFSARGRTDRIDAIRFKLNLNDRTVRSKAIDQLVGFVDRIAPVIAWSRPEDLKPAIVKRQRLTGRSRGVLYQVLPEDGAVERINVVLLLTEPALLTRSDLVIAKLPSNEPVVPVDPAASLPLPQGVTPAFAMAPTADDEFVSEPAPVLPDGAVGPLSPVMAQPLAPHPGTESDEAVEGVPAPGRSSAPDVGAVPASATTPTAVADDEFAVADDEPAVADDELAVADDELAVSDDAPLAGGEPDLAALIDAADQPAVAGEGPAEAAAEPAASVAPLVLPRPRPDPPPAVAVVAPVADPTSVEPVPTLAAPAAEVPPPGVRAAAPPVELPPTVPTVRILPSTAPPAAPTTLPAPVTSFTLPIADGAGEAPGLPGVQF